MVMLSSMARLLCFVVLLPWSLTYLHLQHTLQQNQWLLVSSAENENLVGDNKNKNMELIWWANSNGKECSATSTISSSTLGDVVCLGTTPSITQLTRIWTFLQTKTRSSLDLPLFVTWNNKDADKYPVTSGIYIGSTTTMTTTIQAASAATANEGTSLSSITTPHGFRTNPHKRSPGNGNGLLTQIIRLPTTTLLLCINLGLYWIYWNYDVPVDQVALNGNVFQDFGRAFSGSLAHFEIWHLGFNMMSLASLGQDLEPMYGSIPFFLWTMSLIPLTTLLLLALQWGHAKYSHRGVAVSFEETSLPNIVGFSGILFAWMVVAALDQPRTCPIFFLPDVCFDTYRFLGVSISVGPLVQLVLLQMILPRACFTGHLAGIVAGFGLHWKVLKLEWIQPSILFPMLWIYFKLVRQENARFWFRWRLLLRNGNAATVGEGGKSILIRYLVWIHILLVMVILGSVWKFGLFHSLVLSQLLMLLCIRAWQSAMAMTTVQVSSTTNTATADGCARGYIVLATITTITNAMTLGGWTLTRILWPDFWISIMLVSTTILLHLLSICLACHYLKNHSKQIVSSSDNLILVRVFGWTVMEPGQVLGQKLCRESSSNSSIKPSPTTTRFPGQGETLGSSSDHEQEISHIL